MYAVVKTGGKQLRVQPGDELSIEIVPGEPGDQIELSEVLLIGGEQTRIGNPVITGATVRATIQAEQSGPKVRIFKYKRRKRYRLHAGHRQHYTRIRIDSIEV